MASSTWPPHRLESEMKVQYSSSGLPSVPWFHLAGSLRTVCTISARICEGEVDRLKQKAIAWKRHELSSAIFCSCASLPPPPGRGVSQATQAAATASFLSVQTLHAHMLLLCAVGSAAGAGGVFSTLITTVSPEPTTVERGERLISQGFGGKPMRISSLAPAQPSCSPTALTKDSMDAAPSKVPFAVPLGPRKRSRSINEHSLYNQADLYRIVCAPL
mmetsp:Transcript_38997/g.64764  ORF Transcript_38997/g.64764 Transcript_38997/m.64764 type:complete len:217 (-) Transcript_38997:144-794(-)